MDKDKDRASGGEHVKDLYRVDHGKMYHTDAGTGRRVRLRKGDTFHPTRRQVASGSLNGKASLKREISSVSVGGADIGLRALKWDEPASLQAALDAGIDADEFVGHMGELDYFTAEDVADFLAERIDAREDTGPEDPSEGGDDEPVRTTTLDGLPWASTAAQRLAEELGVTAGELDAQGGTGAEGKYRTADVRGAVEARTEGSGD